MRPKKLNSDQKNGFTLIEILVYGAVFSLFLLLITQVFITIKTTLANSLTMINLQQNQARIFSDLNQTIRGSQNVIAPVNRGSGETLSLNDGQIVYRVTDGVLVKEIGETVIDLSDSGISVTLLSFENLGEVDQKPSIKILMTLDSNYLLTSGKTFSEEFQTTINLR